MSWVVSAFGVRGVWQRHDRENTGKRLKAKVAQEGLILTEAQVAALAKGQGGQRGVRRVRQRLPCFGVVSARKPLLGQAFSGITS